MPENIRPRLFRQSTDTGSRGRERSTSPSLFFRSASASSLLRFRHGRHSVRDGSHLNCERTSGQETEDEDDSQDGIDGTIFDVLPSFQMYNALHRHIPRGNVNADQHDLPPSYQEAHQQSVSCELGVCPGDGNGGSSTTLNSSNSNSYMNLHAISTQHVSLSSTNMADEPIEDDLGDGDFDNINIEKLYSLPKMVTPVEIDIRITKHAVNPDQKPDEESILKEYTSGDIINGYVVIENRSSQPLKFEMFYVTLEGYSTVIDKVNGKRTVKRFLRMVDLSASWSYSSVVSSSGFAYNYGCRDYENCVLGLNNKRVLEPGVKYKKYFMFKFPMRILDVSCKHEQFSHCLVPPSFGIDKFKSNGKYATIRTNPLLGYGHLGTKGSPILTNDLVSETLSINYAVDAKIVGKDSKTGKLNIMRENEYNVRFIPFGFCQPLLGERTPAKQLEALTKLLQDRITALETVFVRLDRNERISNHHLQSTDASGTLENDADLDADDIFRCKLRQLYVDNRLDDAYSSFPLRNIKNLTSSDSTVESEFSYTLKIKNRYSKKKIFFPGFSAGKAEQPDSIRSGIIVLSAKIPTDGLPYIQPSLLKKINRLENKNKHDQKNWKALMEPFSDSEVKVLKNLEIKLRCLQSNNSSPHEPPGISSVTTELLCLTTKSVNSIPIKLDTQLLLSKEKIEGIREAYKDLLKKIRALQARFEKDYVALNELYNLSRQQDSPRELTFNDFIGPQLIHDVECLAYLKVDVRTLHHVFKDQMRTLKAPDDDLSPVTSGGSSAVNLLNVSFSGSSGSHPPSQQYALYKSQVIREWVKGTDNEYTRDVNVNLVLNQDIKETLVPSFESCLCSRMYCIRVNIKFEGHVGTASLEIPVRLRMLEA